LLRGSLFHELLHGAAKSGFSHQDIVKKIAGLEGLDFKALRSGQEAEDIANGQKPNDSSLFEAPMNAWLNKYCGGDAKSWNDFYQKYKKP